MKQMKPWLVAVAMAVALAACGGGGSDDNTPSQEADPLDGMTREATESVVGWIGFLVTLVAILARGEDKEPFEISDLAGAAILSTAGDDTSEPIQVTPR